MVVVCSFGTKLVGWMLTWGVLKPGRVPTSSFASKKHQSVCPSCLFLAHQPFRCWHMERALGPRAAQVPSPQLLLLSTAPLRDCGLARAATDPMSPLGMPSLSLDPVHSSWFGSERAASSGVASRQGPLEGTLPGMGKRAEFLTEFLPIAGCSLGQLPRDRLV